MPLCLIGGYTGDIRWCGARMMQPGDGSMIFKVVDARIACGTAPVTGNSDP